MEELYVGRNRDWSGKKNGLSQSSRAAKRSQGNVSCPFLRSHAGAWEREGCKLEKEGCSGPKWQRPDAWGFTVLESLVEAMVVA